MPNSKLTFDFYFMLPKYDECDKYGRETTIYKNNHVAQYDWALSLKCELPNSNLFIILVLVLKFLIWKRLPKEMLVFLEVPFVNEFQW